MRAPTTVIAVLCLLLAAVGAGAGEMALTRSGTLYQIGSGEEGLILTARSIDGSEVNTVVPQTAGAEIDEITLGVDEVSGTPFIVWQQGESDTTQLMFASYLDGTWSGPTLLAGADGTIASSPDMVVHRETTTIETTDAEGEIITEEISKTFVHVVWWSQHDAEDVGIAMYSAIPVEDNGYADIESRTILEMVDLLPYGIGCSDITEVGRLAHPLLFVDPATGTVNAMAADFTNCLFQVVELVYELSDWDDVEKRGRHGVIFGRTTMIAINPDLPLGDAEIKVGRDLSLVVYWDGEQAVEYTRVDADGWSEVNALPFGEATGIDHEEAVRLIRGLVR